MSLPNSCLLQRVSDIITPHILMILPIFLTCNYYMAAETEVRQPRQAASRLRTLTQVTATAPQATTQEVDGPSQSHRNSSIPFRGKGQNRTSEMSALVWLGSPLWTILISAVMFRVQLVLSDAAKPSPELPIDAPLCTRSQQGMPWAGLLLLSSCFSNLSALHAEYSG